MSIESDLLEVFRETFNDDSIEISRETTAEDIEGWDSLSHVGLIMAAEAKFEIRFNTTEISMLENVGEFMDIIKERTGRE
ncbi:acyl carrier protein [Hyphobacterium sp.]|uniref:acyl carrier protein n=1 Tax=Hyphobacterium sp. TaxID=2004662 RepID=UPI003BAB78C9